MGSFANRLGYSSGSSSSGGPSSALPPQFANLSLDRIEDNPQGALGKVGGFFSNIVGDVVEMGQGINSLVGAGIHDVYQAGGDILDVPLSLLGREDPDRPYMTDELAKSFIFDPGAVEEKGVVGAISPGLQSYVEEAYGVNPLKADLWPDIGKVGHSLYHNPLQTAMDVYGAASLVGRVQGNAALSAARAGDRSAGVLKKLPGLDPESALYDASGKFPGGVRKTLLEASEPTLVEKPLSTNPVKRATKQFLHNRMSRDVDAMAPEIKELAEHIGAMDPETQRLEINDLIPDFQRDVRTYIAAKKLGVSRVEHQPLATFRVQLDAAKRISGFTANTYRLRNEDMAQIKEVFDDAKLSEDELRSFHKYAEGIEGVQSPGRMGLEQLEQYVADLEPHDRLRQATEQMREYIDNLDDPEEIDAARAYVEDLSEAAFLDATSTPIQAAIAKLRVAWHEPLHLSVMNELLPDGYRGHQVRQFGPLLVQDNRAMVEAAGRKFRFEDLAGENSDFWKIKRKEFRDAGRTAPIYYPHLDPRRFKKSDFTLRRGKGMDNLTGRSPYKANNYRLWMQELNFVDDPVEAYARRVAQMRRTIETSQFVEDLARRYGRPITRVDEVAHGEKVFNPRGLKERYRTRVEIDNAIAEFKELGYTDEEALSHALKEVEAETAKRDVEGVVQEGLYAVPSAVADKLDSYSNYQAGDMGRIFFDGPTNAWRAAVLSFSPRWIVNNLLGNIVFLKLQGGKLTDVLRDWFDPKFRGKVDEFLDQMPEDLRATVESGIYSSNEVLPPSLGSAARTEVGAQIETFKQSKVGMGGHTAAQRMQRWNAILENHFRRASVVRAAERQAAELGMTGAVKRFNSSYDRLDDLMGKGFDEADAGRFVDEVNYFFNDYRRLSSFERNVVRRYMMPFYSFYRHAARLTLSYPFAHPERALALRMLGEVSKEIETDLGALPDYLEGLQPIGVGQDEGETRFLNSRNANPLGGFTETLRDPERLLSMVHPIPKAVYESLSGTDTLTGRPFDAPGAAGAFGSDQQYKAIYDDAGNVIGVEPTTVRPNLFETIGRQIPQYDILRDAASLIPGVGEPGVNERYATGEEKLGDPRSFPQELGQLLGLSTTDFDVGQYQERELANRKAALVRILRALGEIPEATV